MKIVIDIPEKVKQTFDNAKDEDLYGNYYDYNSLIGKAIKNGIPLPEGHGDLVDIEKLIDMFWDGNSMEITKYDLSVIEPIIEADRESEEV